MARSYRPVLRDQPMLLAPDMRDWLPADHLVWFLLDILGEIDLGVFHARARRGGRGRRGFDPDLLVGLLIYAYCRGERSSRRIERLCVTDVAFRVMCAGDRPDHTTIARFRAVHQDAFESVFTQVLLIAAKAGLGRFGTVAIDGTKIAAAASLLANRSGEWITAQREAAQRDGRDAAQAQVRAILAEAEEIDEAEDIEHGPDSGNGDQVPVGLADPVTRAARIAAAVAELDAARAHAAEQTAEQDRVQTERAQARVEAIRAGRRVRGRLPAAADRVAEAQARLDQTRATQQAIHDRWNTAIAAGKRPRTRRPLPITEHTRVRAAQARLDKAHHDAARATTPATGSTRAKKVVVNLTDPQSRILPTHRGWVQGYNVQIAAAADQVITAVGIGQNPADVTYYTPMTEQVITTTSSIHQTTGLPQHHLGTLLYDTGYNSHATLTAPGPDRLIAQGKGRDQHKTATTTPTSGPPPADADPYQAMAHRLATPDGAALYKRRGATVEPAIGNLKKLLDRFSRRGLNAARSELHLAAAAFNLLKLYRHTPA